ncbi:hypothetical protein BCV70DRAFT_94711 [Testicularia cyperi]|uniref:Uncharacterized protein n=1 Tax=Testicularia cyperi TaxID=1882483 RepID=A0A317XPV1_9BASI|nr:hypothetical protein BCV70DRAFT_94711 [Testicularia cyperi]
MVLAFSLLPILALGNTVPTFLPHRYVWNRETENRNHHLLSDTIYPSLGSTCQPVRRAKPSSSTASQLGKRLGVSTVPSSRTLCSLSLTHLHLRDSVPLALLFSLLSTLSVTLATRCLDCIGSPSNQRSARYLYLCLLAFFSCLSDCWWCYHLQRPYLAWLGLVQGSRQIPLCATHAFLALVSTLLCCLGSARRPMLKICQAPLPLCQNSSLAL